VYEEAKKTEKESASPPGETNHSDSTEPANEHVDTNAGGPKVEADAPKEQAAPLKISFGLKAASSQKAGPAQVKQSIFKRARTENGADKPVKKVKL
jgi:DNA/RNA-binding protein KIN17